MADQTTKGSKIGIVLFVIGVILFFIVGPMGPPGFVLVLPIVILWVIGWGLVFIDAARRSSTIAPALIVVLILFSFANFYLLAEHVIHEASGLGFGMVHEPPTGHVMLGFILMVITLIATAAIAFKKPAKAASK